MAQADVDLALDDMGTSVSAMTSASRGAITVLNGFQARLDAAIAKTLVDNPGIKPAQLVAITDESNALKSATTDLSAAIVANTPAA